MTSMKKPLWQRCLTRHVVPHLPGNWGVRGILLYREPVDWISTALLA